MDVFEITGYQTGIDESGVTFLNPADAFDTLENGFIFRQVLQSRLGFSQFGNRLADHTRIMGIFENVNPQSTVISPQILVCTKQFLYQYVSGANSFVQIPMMGHAPVGGFNILNNQDYVSGVTYPDRNNRGRFIFCSRGMSDIYYYNGTGVYSFTQDTGLHDGVWDDFTQPPSGNLTKATYVEFFGNRLNFFMPVIAGRQFPQAVLYSATGSATGTGDMFNVPGAGQLGADTSETMRGTNVLGDFMVINFQRSNWTIQKTGNVFNPYFFRKTPSVLGTDASFSDVSYAYEVKSVGKTGLITTDGRQSLRFDNKLHRFTEDQMNQINFDLTYGGFDRQHEQFLYSFQSVEAPGGTVTQDKVLVYNYKEETFSINDQRFTVFGQGDDGIFLTMLQILGTVDPSWARMDTTEDIWDRIGITYGSQKTLAGDDLGFVYQVNTNFDDYPTLISGISQATSAVVTLASAAAFQVGDHVILSNVGGMTQIQGQLLVVTGRTDTSIILNTNSEFYSPFTSGGLVAKTIQFKASMSPFNPYRKLGRKVYLSHIEFLLNTNAGSVEVSLFEDEEDYPFKEAKLVPSYYAMSNILAISQAVNAVISIDSQDFRVGQTIVISGVLGMTQLNNRTATITALTVDSITINIDSTLFTPYTSGGSVVLNGTRKAKEWITISVNSEANFMTMILTNESSTTQTLITSVRIHCSMGGFTTS